MDFVDNLIQDEAFRLSMLYREIETEILIEIARMIKNNGYITATQEYQLDRLLKINSLDMEVIKTVSQITKTPLNDILKVISDVGIASIDFPMYRKAFTKGLLDDIDKLELDPFIKSMIDETTGYIKGVQTKALQQSFIEYRNAIDKAVLSVNSGIKTSNQAMVDSVRELAKVGITGSSYLREGKVVNMGIEPTVYRILRTEFIKTSNDVSHEVGKELGVETWYITQHLGSRYKVHKHEYENHSKWQGTVVTTDELYSIAGYKEITGLGGINCRHRHYAYIEGVSVKPPQQINEFENKQVSDLVTKQRSHERLIRQSKRSILMLEQLGDSEEVNNAIINEKVILKRRQAKLRNLISQSNGVLRRNSANERVVK